MSEHIPEPTSHTVDLKGERIDRALARLEAEFQDEEYRGIAREILEDFERFNQLLRLYGFDEIDNIHQLQEWTGIKGDGTC